MYAPLTVFIVPWIKDRFSKKKTGQNTLLDKDEINASGLSGQAEEEPEKQPIPIIYFLACALADVHGSVFIYLAYNYTTITSVMLLEDTTVPFAVVLSMLFLRIKYKTVHYVGVILCMCGMACSLSNDVFIKTKQQEKQEHGVSSILIGDLFSVLCGFCFALSNILQEFIVRDMQDGFHYLGWLGVFGTCITIFEA